jgi:predicted nucleic acid-binding protein
VTDWLVDKSALVRFASSADAAEWAARIERGLVRIATVTRLEVGYSARSGADLRANLRRPPLSATPVEYQTPAIEDRAVGSRCWRIAASTGSSRFRTCLLRQRPNWQA